MKNEFPTIKQMENSILFAMGSNEGRCEYQEDAHIFIATDLVPYPVRDDGGSIDSIEFAEMKCEISFQEAYKYWLEEQAFYKDCLPEPTTLIPTPAEVREMYEDLPF